MIERRHRLVGGGLCEERVYLDGRLIEVRRFLVGPGAPKLHSWARHPSGVGVTSR